MKNALLLSLFFLLITLSFSTMAQKTLPDSHMNLGVGLGKNYGGIGLKTVIGYRNSGILVGLGAMPGGILGYEIGGQVSVDAFYANLTYGVLGSYQINDGSVNPIKSMSFLVGGMIGLGATKTTFVDLGIGHTLNAPTIQIGPFEENQEAFIFVVGIGFRLLKKKV
jgi:hypothetical protein